MTDSSPFECTFITLSTPIKVTGLVDGRILYAHRLAHSRYQQTRYTHSPFTYTYGTASCSSNTLLSPPRSNKTHSRCLGHLGPTLAMLGIVPDRPAQPHLREQRIAINRPTTYSTGTAKSLITGITTIINQKYPPPIYCFYLLNL